MGSEFHTSEYVNTAWVPKTKLVVFDFDKTITNKHTGGSVQLPAFAEESYIEKNFADLEFFKFVAPFIKAQSVQIGIASFGEDDPDGLLSGHKLIRKYLDVAFGQQKSLQLFPEHAIALWHPESRKQDDKKIGKQDHIAELFKKLGVKCKPSEVVLFDDDKQNIKIASGKGMRAWYCEAVGSKEQEKGKTTGFNREIWKTFVAKQGGSAGGCVLM